MKDELDLGSYDFMECINWNRDSVADFPIVEELAHDLDPNDISDKKAEQTSLKNK